MFHRTLAILCIIAIVAFVFADAACKDDLGSHCGVFKSFCHHKDYPKITMKCAASCGLC